MSLAGPAEPNVPRKKSGIDMVSVLISREAQAAVRTAIGFTGESAASYMSRVLLHQARADRDAGYAEQKAREAEADAPAGDDPGPVS